MHSLGGLLVDHDLLVSTLYGVTRNISGQRVVYLTILGFFPIRLHSVGVIP